jgi:hypothetical protein
MRLVLAIDPGPESSGFAIMDGAIVVKCGSLSNQVMLSYAKEYPGKDVFIEMITSYGMAVGKEVFETCVWIGRFVQANPNPDQVRLIPRRDAKLHLCCSAKAKDTNVRQAIIDRYPAQGDGKCPQIGTKKNPGPLYGVTAHAWPAIAVAITGMETSSAKKC